MMLENELKDIIENKLRLIYSINLPSSLPVKPKIRVLYLMFSFDLKHGNIVFKSL